MRLRTLAAILALVACGTAAGATKYVTRNKLEPANFDALRKAIAFELEPGGRFEFVQPAERSTIAVALDRMRVLLEGKASLAELREQDKVALINAQEEINAILTRRDSERLICQRRELPGSHRKISVCETYGEQQARKGNMKENVRDMQKKYLPLEDNAMPRNPYTGGPGGLQR